MGLASEAVYRRGVRSGLYLLGGTANGHAQRALVLVLEQDRGSHVGGIHGAGTICPDAKVWVHLSRIPKKL